MRQPSKNKAKNKSIRKKKNSTKNLDGSKLETFFKINVLEKLNLNYVQQFEAKSIGRFYDFLLTDYRILIEIDGDYWHMNPDIYQSPINSIQKRNKRVDELKNKWALTNCYILLRFWEKDIYNDTNTVIKFLSERIGIQNEAILLTESKKNGSFFMKKK